MSVASAVTLNMSGFDSLLKRNRLATRIKKQNSTMHYIRIVFNSKSNSQIKNKRVENNIAYNRDLEKKKKQDSNPNFRQSSFLAKSDEKKVTIYRLKK